MLTRRLCQRASPGLLDESSPFRNEPVTDFSRSDARRMMEDALDRVGREYGGSFPLIINGKRVETGQWIDSMNPSHHRNVAVGRGAARATVDDANAAVAAAKKAFESWRDTSAQTRARMTSANRRDSAGAAVRVGGAGNQQNRQAIAGSRCGCRRGDRLLRILHGKKCWARHAAVPGYAGARRTIISRASRRGRRDRCGTFRWRFSVA